MADITLEFLVAAVNDLAVAVHDMRQEMTEGFKRIDGRFQRMDERFDRLENEAKLTRTDLKILAQKYGEHEVSIESLKKAK